MSKKYNITLFIPSLSGGGAERVAVNIANHLDANKYHVTLLTLKQSIQERIKYYEIASHVEVRQLQASKLRTSVLDLMNFFRNNTIDLLISHMSLTNIVSLIAKKLSGKQFPIIIVEHNTPSVKYQNEGWHRKPIPWLMRLTYKHADVIVAVSDGVKEDLAKITSVPRVNIRRIYNPVVSDAIMEKALEPVNHKWLNQKNKYKVILGIGRLERVKNFEMLIDAFYLVYHHVKDARLIILGEGSERRNLEHHIEKLGLKDVVDLPGFVSNPYSYLSRASVFVLTSNYEGLGLVLIEAMAVGTEVIATDCPSGPREILAEGKYGRLIPLGDRDGLARALLDKLIEEDKSSFSVQKLIERAKDFSIDEAIKQYDELICSLLKKGKGT